MPIGAGTFFKLRGQKSSAMVRPNVIRPISWFVYGKGLEAVQSWGEGNGSSSPKVGAAVPCPPPPGYCVYTCGPETSTGVLPRKNFCSLPPFWDHFEGGPPIKKWLSPWDNNPSPPRTVLGAPKTRLRTTDTNFWALGLLWSSRDELWALRYQLWAPVKRKHWRYPIQTLGGASGTFGTSATDNWGPQGRMGEVVGPNLWEVRRDQLNEPPRSLTIETLRNK